MATVTTAAKDRGSNQAGMHACRGRIDASKKEREKQVQYGDDSAP